MPRLRLTQDPPAWFKLAVGSGVVAIMFGLTYLARPKARAVPSPDVTPPTTDVVTPPVVVEPAPPVLSQELKALSDLVDSGRPLYVRMTEVELAAVVGEQLERDPELDPYKALGLVTPYNRDELLCQPSEGTYWLAPLALYYRVQLTTGLTRLTAKEKLQLIETE